MNARGARQIAIVGLLISVIFVAAQAPAEDWPKFLHDLNNSAHSGETGISSFNVQTLKTKWTFSSGYEFSASPAIATINGTSMVFLGAWNGNFYALNAVTGKKIWSFTVDLVPPCRTNSCRIASSAAVDTANNLVFFGAENAYLYALKATTGALVWKQQLGDPHNGAEVWSSPTFFNGMVFVGLASHNDAPCVIGLVNSYNELNGNPVWSFPTIDQSTCPSGTCLGGAVSSSLAIDSTNGIVYAGTGGPGAECTPPTQNATLYPDAVLALNASTGTLLNYYLAVNNGQEDDDFGSSPILQTTGRVNQCTGLNTFDYWVTDMNEVGDIFVLERKAGGLTGTVQTIQRSVGFNASSGFLAMTQIIQCGAGKQQTDYMNTIFAPDRSGALLTLFQNHTGKTVVRDDAKASQKPLFGAPAIIKDIVLFGGQDQHLYVSKTNGSNLLSFKVKGPVSGGVAISNSRVYFATSLGYLYCMSPNGK
jgi:outer membrane protein assembly factor BamB